MDGGLVDMARSGSDESTTPLILEENKYPYGLRITLTHDEIEKLNVDHSDWEIGDEFCLDIVVKVVSKSSHEAGSGDANHSVTLQITHMGAEEEEGKSEHEDEEPSLENHGYLRYKT